jgi:hypothetical protein
MDLASKIRKARIRRRTVERESQTRYDANGSNSFGSIGLFKPRRVVTAAVRAGMRAGLAEPGSAMPRRSQCDGSEAPVSEGMTGARD